MNGYRWSSLAAVCGVVTVAVVAAGSLIDDTAQAAAGGTGTGHLSTRGAQIVDAEGVPVRLTGLNWFGMETDDKTFHGLWSR